VTQEQPEGTANVGAAAAFVEDAMGNDPYASDPPLIERKDYKT